MTTEDRGQRTEDRKLEAGREERKAESVKGERLLTLSASRFPIYAFRFTAFYSLTSDLSPLISLLYSLFALLTSSFLLLISCIYLHSAGTDVLNINKGARASVFGDSFVSIADETSAVHYNPAGLGFIYSPELQMMHNIYVAENSLTSLGYMRPDGFGVAAISADYFSGPKIKGFEDGTKLSDFTYYTAVGNLGYGLKIFPSISFGLSLKYLYDVIGDSTLSLYGSDTGLLIRTIDEVFSAGVAGRNLYSSPSLPKTYLGGFSFKWSLPEHYSDIILAFGYNQTENKKPVYSAAIEHIGARILGLRVGYRHIEDKFQQSAQDSISRLTAGASIRIKNIQINYAYNPLASLGDTHTIDFQWRFLGWYIRKKKIPISLKVEPTVFSPNSDGAKDVVFFIPETTGLKKVETWKLKINNASGATVKTYSDKESYPKIIAWDGKDAKGGIPPEGTYKAYFTAEDRTTFASSDAYDIKIDLTPPAVLLTLATGTFNITEESLENNLTFYMSLSDLSGIDFWQLNIYNEKKRSVKTFKSTQTVSEVVWNGKDDYYGLFIPEGNYIAKLMGADNAGNRHISDVPFSVIRPPKETVKEVVKEIVKEVRVKEEARGLVMTMASHILYDHGKSEIKPQAKKALDEVIEIINTYPQNKVLIEGHTDSVGSAESNRVLSSKRAWGIYSYLVKNGVEPARLSVKGWGKERPVASNKTEAGRTQNRRVEITILKNP